MRDRGLGEAQRHDVHDLEYWDTNRDPDCRRHPAAGSRGIQRVDHLRGRAVPGGDGGVYYRARILSQLGFESQVLIVHKIMSPFIEPNGILVSVRRQAYICPAVRVMMSFV